MTIEVKVWDEDGNEFTSSRVSRVELTTSKGKFEMVFSEVPEMLQGMLPIRVEEQHLLQVKHGCSNTFFVDQSPNSNGRVVAADDDWWDGEFTRSAPYPMEFIARNGCRTPLRDQNVCGLVAFLGGGKEVELDLAPHPGFRGHVVAFAPAISNMAAFQTKGVLDDFFVHFGASNVLHICVDRRETEPQST